MEFWKVQKEIVGFDELMVQRIDGKGVNGRGEAGKGGERGREGEDLNGS